ncbi:hypothetical protein [Salinigranum marinum]|uniref:hypothetical protein n=1 Tax=Salinigranum marinum TaxID=1515595 RepID=UPI002989D7EF|nr:hypothetical protein [Salinigranum marinum]
MTGTETIERAIQQDPHRLPEYIDDITRQLASDDVHDRVDAGRAFRVAAAQDAALVEPYHDLVVDLLGDGNGSLQLSGLVAVAELAADSPERVADEVPRLLDVVRGTDAPAIEMAAIKALTRIGEWSPPAVEASDPVVADRLRTATTPIRTAVVSVFVSAVIERPSTFPATVRATEAALDDDSARVRRYAASAVSLIAESDAAAVSSPEAVRTRVAEIEARVNDGLLQPDQNLIQALDRLDSVVDADGN